MAEEAQALAKRELADAGLYSVLVNLPENPWLPAAFGLNFGFQELKHGLVLGTRLKVCRVEFQPQPRCLRIVSTGVCGRRQFRELAAIQGFQFPPPTLDLNRGRLEAPQVLSMLQRTSPFGPAVGSLDLSLGDQ